VYPLIWSLLHKKRKGFRQKNVEGNQCIYYLIIEVLKLSNVYHRNVNNIHFLHTPYYFYANYTPISKILVIYLSLASGYRYSSMFATTEATISILLISDYFNLTLLIRWHFSTRTFMQQLSRKGSKGKDWGKPSLFEVQSY
jgi:hypothetical protein